MSVLYISEFTGLSSIGTKTGQVAPQPSLVDQVVAISGAPAISAAFGSKTYVVRLETDVVCSILFGFVNTIDAATTNARMAANQTEYFAVAPGMFVSVIANT